MSTVLEKLAARQKAAEDTAASLKAKRRPEDATELVAREAAEAAEAKAREEAARDRKLDLARRFDLAQEKNLNAKGELKPLRIVDLDETAPGAGSYIVRAASEDAVKLFHKRTGEAGFERSKLYRDVAADAVVDFNGADEESIDGAAMHALWREFPMVPVTLGNAALELGGFAAETRKSGG